MAEIGSGARFEIAHVLFMDVVGYSKLLLDEQRDAQRRLSEIVRDTEPARAAEAAGNLISIPTGDGMALVFFHSLEAPVQCAVEIAHALKKAPNMRLRMGIHSGPVHQVRDVNDRPNVAGGGINMAQRVMDCGDAGHILLSKSVADVLSQLSQWSPYLTDLGECTVKHGVKLQICNLATADLGNRKRPNKLAAASGRKTKSKAVVAGSVALILISIGGVWWFGRGGTRSAPAAGQESIAVLKFVDISPEKNQEYFSEGLAEELLDTLSKIPGLRVAARTSSFQFGDKTGDCREIARKL